MKNNFKKIEEDLIAKYGEPAKQVKKNIDGTFGVYKLTANVVDLFFVKPIDTFINLTSNIKPKNKK